MKKPYRRKILYGTLLLMLVVSSLWYWRQAVVAKRAVWSATALKEAMATKDYLTARSTLTAIPDPIERAAKEQEIRIAELSDAIEKRDGAVIRQASWDVGQKAFSPELLEKADLVVAREALWNRD
jgi:hypothetical protein